MRVVVTGGGTGGHIYPALAFVNYVKTKEPESKFLYVGADRGLENKILPQTDIPFKTLQIQGFKRSFSFENLKTIRLFLKSIREAKKLLKEFKPDVVIGTGGYVSGAVVYAAAKLKIPTIVHEQNSVPGVTNKFLTRYVDKVAICFKDAQAYFPKEKTELVGNPRAQEIATIKKSDVLKRYDLDPKKKTVLIFGGSQGALKINQAVVAAIPTFSKKNYQLLYVSGERYYEEIEEEIGISKDVFSNISIRPYIDQMPEVMVNCDLLIGRAGATSIAEFTGFGLPAILVPSPYVTNDHQTKNAMSLVNAGAVKMIKDQELTAQSLVNTVDEIMNDDSLRQKMAQASKKQGISDASDRLYALTKKINRA
ncbi:MAG TPA: undecaprenyldiphospho-muramoylpentapeptide beta-N-acetylglucosaminyltransferase [Candidatus Tetragenococcus pullicola]|nr:undecaprenyldiphospho-muramoylpentapeptide beta-N-acetylglucosaminyltransferase [Candidatus Tetragenococcus pullicola]